MTYTGVRNNFLNVPISDKLFVIICKKETQFDYEHEC